MSSFGLTPAERGTALHEFMQFADYEAANHDAQAECDRIVKQGYLTSQQAQTVDLSKAQSFFKVHWGNACWHPPLWKKKNALWWNCHYQLWKHICRNAKTETAVLRGAVDCVFEEDGALVIVDFKNRPGETCKRTVGTLPSAIGTVRIRNGAMLRKACKKNVCYIRSISIKK